VVVEENKPPGDISGILLADKPKDITSFGVVDRIKKHFTLKKVGHGGTLDPMATGLLIILINRGTKMAGRLLGADKEYRAVIRWGIRTDTQDRTGKILKKAETTEVERGRLESALRRFRGGIERIPPMFSALKYRGRRLYELAREGREIKREPRKVTIKKLDLEKYFPDRAVLRIVASKGTYIRTLAADLGEEIGSGGCLEELERIRSGPFSLDEAVDLDRLFAGGRTMLEDSIIPPDKVLSLTG